MTGTHALHSIRARTSSTCALIVTSAIAMLLIGLAPAGATAAPSPIIAPKKGKVIRSHLVTLRVRAGDRSQVLQARLNGVPIGEDFGRTRKGVRRFKASASEGLRHGKNRLKVRVRRYGKRPLRQRTTFYVRRGQTLLGAGRNRRAAVETPIEVRGKLRQGRLSKLRWRLIRGPRGMKAKNFGSPLSSKAGLGARFTPPVTGRYVLELAHGGRRPTVADRVRVDVVPPTPLVKFNTDVQEGFPVIQVGDELYDGGLPNVDNTYQVVVLNRKTTGLVASKVFHSSDDLGAYIDTLAHDDGKLVIVVAHRRTPRLSAPAELLEPIGIPALDSLPKGGRFVAVGVPGMKPGAGDWVEDGGMTGYLTPDQYRNYGFVPPQRKPFSYGGKEVPPCPPGDGRVQCNDEQIGFKLGLRDALTLDPLPGDGEVFATNLRTAGDGYIRQVAAVDMAHALKSAPDGAVVTIEVVSNRRPGEDRYPAPVGAISRDSMVRLSKAVASVGGTRNGFNRTVLQTGAPESGGAIYTLVGWAGAGEGAGAEAATGLEEAGEVPLLSGVLRPDRSSQFRPAEVTASATNPQLLQELQLAKPSGAWPLDDDPGARRAISYLGSSDQRLGPDPRSAYWMQAFGESTTNSIIAGLKSVPYPSDADFTQAEFEAARAQLVKELGWVGNVRAYLKNLSTPFADNALPSWVAAQKIADRVYNDANKPEDEVALRWVEFTRIILELLGPLTEDVSAVVGDMLDLGVWAYGAGQGGQPTDSEVRTEANNLGAELVEQAQQAQVTYDRMGDVIVSDYAKLSVVGPKGGCNATSPDCPPELAFSSADRTAASADVYRSIERLAYTKLLPLGYHVFALNPHEGRWAPDLADYQCAFEFPFNGYWQSRYASWPLLQELDPTDANNDWEWFLFSTPPGAFTTHGTGPSEDLLNRMFNPVSTTGDPKEGGLGMSLATIIMESDHDYWMGSVGKEGRRCRWIR